MDQVALKNLCSSILKDYFRIGDNEELGRPFVVDKYDVEVISDSITQAIQKVTIMIKINHDNDDLWCIESKERIYIGEKYVIIKEDVLGEIIEKTYKLDEAPIDFDEDDEPYICE